MINRRFAANSMIGEYRLVDFLGAGGMGEVYRAVQVQFGRVVAIKILIDAECDASALNRFLNEATIQSSLRHENIATLYHFIEHENYPCIVMEYVDGETLSQRISQTGALPMKEAMRIFRDVVGVITYLHGEGVVHRDIKSNNIKIASDGHIKLLDFGIAQTCLTPRLTETGKMAGTIAYMSPEQLRGEAADARSDIWALGVLLYEMVTQHTPFAAAAVGEMCTKIAGSSYLAPSLLNPLVPREVDEVIARCLKKNPAHRYKTARELLQGVMRVALDDSAQNPQNRLPKRTTKISKDIVGSVKRDWRSVTAALVVIIVAIGAGLLINHREALPTNSMGRSLPHNKRNCITSEDGMDESLLRTVRIYTYESDSADVYCQGGDEVVGTVSSKKPFEFKAKLNSSVHLVLQRQGYENKTLNYVVTDNIPADYIRMKQSVK